MNLHNLFCLCSNNRCAALYVTMTGTISGQSVKQLAGVSEAEERPVEETSSKF